MMKTNIQSIARLMLSKTIDLLTQLEIKGKKRI